MCDSRRQSNGLSNCFGSGSGCGWSGSGCGSSGGCGYRNHLRNFKEVRLLEDNLISRVCNGIIVD
jgi:hypothetical protein